MDIEVQTYTRTLAETSPDNRRVGPFVIRFDSRNPLRYLNYAIPDDGAEPTADDVAALIAAFRERERLPRLEYLPTRAPLVEAALLAGGFTVENRAPIMVCPPGAVTALTPPDGVTLTEPADDTLLLAGITVQTAAFGDDPPGPDAVEGQRRAAKEGAIFAVAVASDGTVVGAGQSSRLISGVTEVGGVAVDAGHRRRGIGAAVTGYLTATAYERGARAVFLEPAGPDEQRIYARVGFQSVGEKLNISLT